MKLLIEKNRVNSNQAGFLSLLIMLILFWLVPFSLRGSTISGTFTTLATCPVRLSAMAVDPTTGYFYAVADQNQTAAYYRYSASADTWTNMASAPPHQTGNNAGATYLNGNIYVSYTGYPDLSVYSISGNSWTTITGPTGGTYTGDISNDGTNVYTASSGFPGKFWRFKVSDGTWTQLTSVPRNDKWGGLSYNNGYFYSSGGNGNTSFQRYQVSTDSWTSLTDVPGGAVLGAAIYDAYYYCMGSYSGTNLYSYDLGAREWNNVLTLPWGINDATICVYGNSLYIIQGEAGTGFVKFTPNNPMLTNIESSAIAYNIGDAAAVISSTITASQNAGTNFQSATVTISASFETGKDILSFVDANGITGSWNSSTGVLTLTGTTTISNYQAALRSVTYLNTDITSTKATRTLSFKVYDGAQYSNTANRNLYFPGVPILSSTTAISSITTTTATSGGFVSEDGGSTVTARGICWATTSGPLVTGSNTVNGSGLGSFTSLMTGLTSGVTYYVRAYATNSTGTDYGNELTFTTLTPVITVSTASVSGFTACDGGAASSPLNFTVSGINLAEDITVTAPAQYEVSKLAGSGFGNTVTLTQSGGTVLATTIYSRMLTTSVGIITGNISVTSSGATTKTVALSGSVSPLATGGSISGTGVVIYGLSSGTMTLSGYSGTIIRWEKKLESGSWTTIVNTLTTYSENPASAGTWYYRAVISSGACPNAYSSEFTLTVSKKELTVVGATPTSKVYDGNTSAVITGGTLSGIVGSDVVILATNTSGIFASSGVGAGISVTSTMTLSGAAAGNYYLTQPSLSANITAKTLTVAGAVADNKVYDGNTTTAITGGTLTGIVGSDVVTLENNTAGLFASAGAGTGIAVATSMTLSGASSGNYLLTQPNLAANIIAKTLTIINATADNKIYDGTLVATIAGATLSGIVGSDDVTLANTSAGTFATAVVGTAKTVTSAMTLSGAAAGNYTLAQPALSANITARILTVTGASAINKVYDGNTDAIIAGGDLTGVVGSDVVTLSNNTTGTFASPNSGTGYLVTTVMTLSGADAANYALIQPALFADITNRLLTVTGATASNKEYDGTKVAEITGGTLSGLIGSDAVTLANNTTGTFATANAGNAIQVTTAMTIEGAEAGLYTLVQPSLTADISRRTLTATADNKNKVMGRSNPVLTISYKGFITDENASLITEPSVSTTAVTSSVPGVYPITLSGGSVANYTLLLEDGVLTVEKAILTITANNKSKIYGSENPPLTLSYSGFVNGDDASVITPPSLATPALSGSDVGLYPIIITGGSASNYTLALVDGTMTISKAVLTITASNLNKVYGSLNPVLALSYTGFVNGDNESVLSIKPALATSASTSSGTGIYSIIPSEGAADNYSLNYVNGTLTVVKKMLTVTAEKKYRVFNQPDPVFTMTYSGFALNEGVAVITTLPSAHTTATMSSPAGLYPIIPAGGVATNYDFTYLNGILLISSIAGDVNGDGIITNPEINGDTNGDGVISGTEIAGDTSGDGSISGNEVAGDTNSDGKITGTEIAGDTDGDGIISGSELTGDSNGDGSIDGNEVSGDTNGDGIIGSGEIRVIDPQKDYPNINHLFTPNNDGINDYWILPDLDKYGISDVKVYNRWGKLVYSNKHYDNQWDGTSNGVKLPDGAYYYIIKTEKAGIISGTVNILR